jgi:hypothetical protein
MVWVPHRLLAQTKCFDLILHGSAIGIAEHIGKDLVLTRKTLRETVQENDKEE